ncbi:MAG: hypothetical protein J6E32_04425 [Lachnospiraceae bacterium]|nr:hypothetical protein [Lachnospiraceae bacterium]
MEDDKTILIGIQISADGAQITWYNSTLTEPQTLSLPGEGEDGLMSVPAEAWKGAMRGGRFGTQALARYLGTLIETVPGEKNVRDLRVAITVPALSQSLGEHFVAALESLDIERKNIFLQDWRTSFYYYVVSMRRELWSGDVAFLRVKNQQMIGSILHIDRSVKPGVVTIDEVASTDVSDRARGKLSDEDWDKERDRLFYELLGRLFERRNVTTSYLYGNYFDRSWAQRSFQYLTFRRHAFQGQNLFSKGACYCVMARLGFVKMPDLLFMGVDQISEDIGIRVRVRGKEQYQVLIPAGLNWYEAHCQVDMIPDDEKSVTILTTPAEGGETVGHILRLDHFPERENRATRLRMTIYFTAPGRCEIEVEDMGFGGFHPSTGRIWKRQVIL